ncbi:hypothetical protein BGZ52_003542 [Haplosporangium bisporale]|nr:hypothetical protein BGZ52_003542 [Haplosporangium bisporale]KAI9231645.1 MAG: hypothetical protein BYD32DRAFT_430305 [Podila humilis]KFH65992.1 hypothetical protein MVEG_08094 [Podila verticillata NRRL 6337]
MAATGQDQQRETHLISLKVMRLSRPSLVTGHSLYFGSPHNHSPQPADSQGTASIHGHERPHTTSILTDALSDLSLTQLERVHPPSSATLIPPTGGSDHMEGLDMGDFGVSELLTMPASFGNIYLGETFTSYICANNEWTHPVRDVILKAELQTSTLRFALSNTLSSSRSPSDSPSGIPAATGGHIQLLESGRTNEMIVSHEIKELGIHILVCSVQYTTLDGQQKSFRKFYKFQVLNPLSVKTKVNQPSTSSASSQEPGANGSAPVAMSVSKGGLVLLEAMVQNVSGVTMWMERMRFEVSDAFTVRDLNVAIPDRSKAPQEGEKGVSVFGEHDYFAPNDVRQYLYVLTPKPGKELLAKTTNVLGKMDILWRSQFGETGRLQTSQLTRKPAPLEDIAVQVVKVPERIQLEQVFSIEIVVKNQSSTGTNNSSNNSPVSPNPPPRASTSPPSPFQPQSLTGSLARPPAAVARGGAPPIRPLDSSSSASNLIAQGQGTSGAPPSQEQNAMKLMLTGVKQKMGAILLSGPNSRQLGSVPAGGEVRVRLDWFPLTSGVQKIGGIRIVDIISGYTVELDHLTHCFVEHT